MHFYATKSDLLPVCAAVERIEALQYVSYNENAGAAYASAIDLPDLGIASGRQAAACRGYLVAPRAQTIFPRYVQTPQGERLLIDQLANHDTITLWTGGVWQRNVLLNGRIDTAWKDSKSGVRLLRRFEGALRRQFLKIGAFRVGPEAAGLLDSGWRLTQSEDSPPLYDLVRDKAV